MRLLILDNYDSFVYNLVHMVRELGIDHDVYRNDKISAAAGLDYDAILLSPGPGVPDGAGNMKEMIKICAPQRPILGVCLGHQALAESFGGSLSNLDKVVHGRATEISQTADNQLFKGLEKDFIVGRYHSWVVNKNDLNPDFKVTATDDQGNIMAMEHLSLPIAGVQFHPESIMTPDGMQMIKNFLAMAQSSTL